MSVWMVGNDATGWLYMRGDSRWELRRRFASMLTDCLPETVRVLRMRCLDNCPPEGRARALQQAGHPLFCCPDALIDPDPDVPPVCDICGNPVRVQIEGDPE